MGAGDGAGRRARACLPARNVGWRRLAGYVLGGGIGWLARRDGFASSHVRSLEVVTADGAQRVVDVEHEPDLFWSLRGGGGLQAIVATFELELFELREAFAGTLFWPIERAAEIVHAYRAWIASAPATATSTLRLMRFPPLEQLPEPLRGRALVTFTVAFTGPEADGAELVAPLRAVAPPYLDRWQPSRRSRSETSPAIRRTRRPRSGGPCCSNRSPPRQPTCSSSSRARTPTRR